MQLTTGSIHTLFVGLSLLEQNDAIKLTGDVRLKIALNRSKLEPLAAAYERARGRLAADLLKANRELPAEARRSSTEVDADMAQADAQMRDVQQDVDLKTVLKADLRLDDNPRITGAMISQLLPILEGLE